MNTLETLVQYIDNQEGWESVKTFRRHEYLKRSKAICTDIYFVESGSVRAFVESNGEEQNIRFGYKNSIITPLDSYISEQPTDILLQALKKSTVRIIPKTRFTELINKNPEMKDAWLQILQGLILSFMERERDLLISDPAIRYQRVLKRSPKLFQEIPRKHIASYLRMTPETLSRVSAKNIDSNQYMTRCTDVSLPKRISL